MCVLLSKGSLLQFMAVTHFRSGRDAAPLYVHSHQIATNSPLLETQGSKENVTNEVLQYEVKRYGYQNNFI